jgi:hypothetical protein
MGQKLSQDNELAAFTVFKKNLNLILFSSSQNELIQAN